MPPFRPDPTKVSAGFEVFEKGSYEVELGEPKPFLRETKTGKNIGNINHGVMFRCIITEGPKKGRPYIYNAMMHTTESEQFSKQFQMAAYGFSRKQEKEFDEQIGGTKSWEYDPQPDNGGEPTCGDGWRDMKGKRVIVDLDVGKDPQGQDQQKFLGVRPVE